ncbi:hypothetical protein FJV80_12170 [Mesorhizobium sp. WSM4310]|uniref:hypothetical protein n=1 Tax=Mesorhizobium sp. WSM4310 TaxID=2589883 RepID=UPI00115E9F7B|nr:hypothetical protein [Mesorhizobium sp. WSM4310]TRC87887.1 hypothetical protein FJV80_12170 [Mesorhizobium sp. WSM4310]
MATFTDVKNTLDALVAMKDISRMKLRHGGDSFSWTTAGELRSAVAQIGGTAYRLIPPEFVGNRKADETYLVRILSGPIDEEDLPQMPFRGPFATANQIKVIQDWINAGALDDPITGLST